MCKYVATSADWESWGGDPSDWADFLEDLGVEGEKWVCPYETFSGYDTCIFHTPSQETSSDVDEVDYLLSAIEDSRGDFVCLGLNLESLSISDAEFDSRLVLSGSNIDQFEIHNSVLDQLNLRHTVFNNIEFRENVVNRGAVLSGMFVDGAVDFTGTVFEKHIDLKASIFAGKAYFRHTEFKGGARFTDVSFQNHTDFSFSTFKNRAVFGHASFAGMTDFSESVFQCKANFGRVEFKTFLAEGMSINDSCQFTRASFNRAIFNDCEFHEEAIFKSTVFVGEVKFTNCTFQERTSFVCDLSSFLLPLGTFQSRADFSNSSFQGESDFRVRALEGGGHEDLPIFMGDVNFSNVYCADETKFFGTTFNQPEDVILDLSDFSDSVFEGVDLSGASLRRSDFTGTFFKDADLSNADLEHSMFTRAVLNGADITGAKISGVLFGDAQLNDKTQILGGVGNASRYCYYDPRYGEVENRQGHFLSLLTNKVRFRKNKEEIAKAKNVYRSLEDLARSNAYPNLQSSCFVSRQDLQREKYLSNLLCKEDTFERMANGGRYIRASTARAILLYGESPWRVVSFAFISVAFFTLAYPAGNWLIPIHADGTYGEPLGYAFGTDGLENLIDSLYFSALTFTTLGFGDFEPVGFGKVLATLNTSIGALLVALLVWVLGRRAAR